MEPAGGQEAAANAAETPPVAQQRFRAADLLGDARLARLALGELHGQQEEQQKGAAADGVALADDEHMARMLTAAEHLTEDVSDETSTSGDLAELIIQQLHQSKGDVAQVASVLGAIHAAEAAWAGAMRTSLRSLKLPSSSSAAARRPSPAASTTSSAADRDSTTSAAAASHAAAGNGGTSSAGTSAPGTPSAVPTCAQALAALPAALLAARQEVSSNLPPLQQHLQQLVARYARACKELAAERDAMRRAVEAQRGALRQAVAQHGAAAGALELWLRGREAGRKAAWPAGAVDPWQCEHSLLLALRALIRLQDKELAFLQTCFSQARDLEIQRNDAFEKVLSTLSEGHTAAAHASLTAALRATGLTSPGGAAGDAAEPALHPHHPQQHHEGLAGAPTRAALLSNTKLEELTRAAATASEAAQGLATKQAERVQEVQAELFCSPEIVRQGELESWDGVGQWRSGHAVLTRAGSLFIFAMAPDGNVGDLKAELNLARMQFEAGQAPRFHLVHDTLASSWAALLPGMAARAPKLSFQALTVEDCCEWAIAIREAIAVASGRQ